MTGDEHYREAERLMIELGGGQNTLARKGGNKEDLAIFNNTLLGLAQVHATLALAAATNHADHYQEQSYSTGYGS